MEAFRCILFDLDGTLVDTAPDLVGALNALRAERDMPPLPLERLRGVASHGAAALLLAGFPGSDAGERKELVRRYLALYRSRIAAESRLFPGIDVVLETLDRRDVPWGVVTNKPAALTRPLLAALDLDARARFVVCGDDLAERKPHPAPVLHGCRLCAADPAATLYLGDAERDVESGRAAGAVTAVALWGYLDGAEDPAAWNADHYLETPDALLAPDFGALPGRSVHP